MRHRRDAPNARASRRGLTLVVCGAAAIVLTSCSSASTTATSTTSTPGSKKLTIAFVMGAEADPFFKAMKVGADAEAADPAQYSPATQIPYVDQVLAQKPSGLVLIPTDPDALL